MSQVLSFLVSLSVHALQTLKGAVYFFSEAWSPVRYDLGSVEIEFPVTGLETIMILIVAMA